MRCGRVCLLTVCLAALLSAQRFSTAARKADLDFVASQVPALHANFFYQLDPSVFQAAVASLNAKIGTLTDAEFYVQLAALVAMAGDAHTMLNLFGSPAVQAGFGTFPLQFQWLDDGVFVTGASPDYSQALSAQLVQVGGVPIDQVMQKLGALIPHDNDQWLQNMSQLYLPGQQILQGLDIAPAGATTPLKFRTLAGDEFTLNVGTSGTASVFAPSPSGGPLPDYVTNATAYYWAKYLTEERLVYFKYNLCNDDPSNPFSTFTASVMTMLDTNPVDTLVMDFRGNPGGSTSYFEQFGMEAATRLPTLAANPKFRIYVAIDKGTFSSGMEDAMQFKSSDIPAELQALGTPVDLTGRVIVIGQPTGGKPSGYGEVQPFALPGSRLLGQYSTKFFAVPNGIPDGPSFSPDIRIGLRSTDYFARHDPVLAAILARTEAMPASPTGTAIVVNGASFRSDQGLAPGSFASAFGAFSQTPDEVRVNGVAARVMGGNTGQVNFLVPASITPGSTTVSVRAGGTELANGQVAITAVGPGIFVLQALDPSQPGAVENQDYSVNSRSNPAAPGSVVQIFATGYGQLSGPPQVFFGDTPAQVLFSGELAQYPGLWQIDAVAPLSLSGQIPVFIIAGNLSSNAVTISVR
jgi:uncharacterized protein (TIGR03437 family)